jgi:hypothetical protein
MDNSTFLLLLSLVALLGMASCSQPVPTENEDTLARVGNEYLTIDEAKSAIPDFIFQQDSIGALQKYRDNWMQKQVLLQEAQRLGLSQQEEVRKKLRKAREEVLREALKDYVLGSKQEGTDITDEEARAFYQTNKEKFALDEKFVQFRHLTTRTIKEARSAKQDLLDGVPWPEVAQEYAIDPEVAIEESEQFWPISMALNDLSIMNRYLNIIGQNEISPIQRINGVYHFVQLIDSRAKGEQPDLDWLIEKIKDWMRLNKQQRNFSSYVKNLYLKAKSNNEVESFNVLPNQTNQQSTFKDTLESTSTNE